MLAGLKPQRGLSANVAAPLIYMLFASSRQVVLGPESLTAILVKVACVEAVGAGAEHEEARFRLALAITFLNGLMQVAASLFRLGFIARLISTPVMKGFVSGAGLIIMCTQLGALTGLSHASKHEGNFVVNELRLLRHIGDASLPTIALGACSMAVLVAAKLYKKLPSWFPTPMLLMALTLLLSYAFDFTKVKD